MSKGCFILKRYLSQQFGLPQLRKSVNTYIEEYNKVQMKETNWNQLWNKSALKGHPKWKKNPSFQQLCNIRCYQLFSTQADWIYTCKNRFSTRRGRSRYNSCIPVLWHQNMYKLNPFEKNSYTLMQIHQRYQEMFVLKKWLELMFFVHILQNKIKHISHFLHLLCHTLIIMTQNVSLKRSSLGAPALSVGSLCFSNSLLQWSEFRSGLKPFQISRPDQLSRYDASCLSKREVASNNISGEKADVGELLRGCEA